MVFATCSQYFCFDFHISAEQFHDRRNKQGLVKMGENHELITNIALSNDGSSVKMIDQSHGD